MKSYNITTVIFYNVAKIRVISGIRYLLERGLVFKEYTQFIGSPQTGNYLGY